MKILFARILLLCYQKFFHIDSPRDLPESQALSKTFDLNSNYETSDELRSVSPLERADSPMKDDYDSDWDSWEEEDEVRSPNNRFPNTNPKINNKVMICQWASGSVIHFRFENFKVSR